MEYTLLKPDCHSWWILKMQSGREDTLEERYAIKFCFKLGKKATETYGMLQTAFRPSCMSGIRDSRKPGSSLRDDERCGRSKEVNTPELIGQRVRVRVIVEVLREFRKRFRRKRPALFKSGQWHFHKDNAPVHNSIVVTDYLTKMAINTIPQPPYSPDLSPCDFCLFPKLNWGDERGCDEGHWHAHTRGVLWSLPEVVGTVQVHCSRRRLLLRGLEFHVCTINKSHHHHHIVLAARISLTLSRHSSLSFIALGRSSGQQPVSSHSCWMYVRAGRPAFARPCVGIHKSTSLMSSSLLLQQCPACLVRLTWIVFVIGGRWPYSWCLVGCCCQDLFRIARSILV